LTQRKRDNRLTVLNKLIDLKNEGEVQEVFFSSDHRQLMCSALKSTSGREKVREGECICKKELYNEQSDHAVCMWLL
jgi:hypothetical protein